MREKTNYKVPPMRTIGECAKLLRQADPETALTEHAIRTLVLKGLIPHTPSGKKYLINLDLLLEYLYSGTATENSETEAASSPGIRRVSWEE